MEPSPETGLPGGPPDAPAELRFQVASALREVGAILGALGENRFRARAYAKAAAAVEVAADLAAMADERRLTDLPFVGESLARVIDELVRTGRTGMLERLRAQVPAGVLELASLRGLSLDKARALHEALGVSTVPELEAAARAGRVQEVKGFGAKTEAKLLDAIERHREGTGLVRLVELRPLARQVVEHVRRIPGVEEAELAGEVRRFEDAAAKVVVVARTGAGSRALDALSSFPLVARVESREAGDPGRVRVRLATGLPVELVATSRATWAGALVAATSAPEHLAALAELALERGLALDARGLTCARTGRRVATATEAELYERLGLPLLPPEVRGDAESVAAARAGDAFDDLITEDDLRGAVHCRHTVWSDGADTVEAMARMADELGYEYLTITDHSPAAHYAGGVEPERLREQWREVARAQELVRVRLLRGTECDILPDGALDYGELILSELDVVIASIHARNRQDEDAMTARLVRAMEAPLFKVWGHPLGRLVLTRPGVPCRVEEVLDAAARSPAAIEVNGDPYRLDLEPRWLRAARRRGLRFVLSHDAHSAASLRGLSCGVGVARRGWLRKGEVLNTLPAAEFAAAVAPRRT